MNKTRIKFYISIVLMLTLALFIFFLEDFLISVKQEIYIILFIYFLLDSLEVILPFINKEIYSSKMTKRMFVEIENYDEKKLNIEVRKNNRRALLVFVLYVFGVLIVGLSYLHFDWFTEIYLYLVFLTINVGDYFCLIVWCPFRSIFLKNTCCNTCRISNWDRWMKVSILLFIPNIFTISINIVAFSIFIYWEYNHFKYPERFYRRSNKTLLCSNCDTHSCGKPLI